MSAELTPALLGMDPGSSERPLTPLDRARRARLWSTAQPLLRQESQAPRSLRCTICSAGTVSLPHRGITSLLANNAGEKRLSKL